MRHTFIIKLSLLHTHPGSIRFAYNFISLYYTSVLCWCS